MREEIYELAKKYNFLKYATFKGFKTNKQIGAKSVFNNIQKVLVVILTIIILIVLGLLIKFNVPKTIIAIGFLFLIYILLTVGDSIVDIKVKNNEKKIFIKKIFKKYEINFEDIQKIYLATSDSLKGIKAKIRIIYKKENKDYNLSIETGFLKTKDIKNFISQIEIEENEKDITKSKNKDKDKKSILEQYKQISVDETVFSSLDLFILICIGIVILIDIAI